MTDSKTLAYINMFAILGALPTLCALNEKAAALASPKKPIALCMTVKNGPAATFTFDGGKVTVADSEQKCDIKLPFSSCEKFNGLIDGTVTPIPSKGFTKISFLLKNFIGLTDILASYLKPDKKALEDEKFFADSTELMLGVIGRAVAQIANHDKIGSFSSSNVVDGVVHLSIRDGACVSITVKDHIMQASEGRTENPRAIMEFADIHLARDLFDGKVNAMNCIGKQQISMCGMISMLDNINRILDRVAAYLA